MEKPTAKKYRTDFLFRRTSALIGAGSVFNLGGNYFKYNFSENADDADMNAIESDWRMIGDDMRSFCDPHDSAKHDLKSKARRGQ